ncbi:MAG: hypothetical protein AAF623_07120, partial [Planctomycetota bacterium]
SVYKICHPQTATSWATAIQAHLGLPTTIDSIETPNPYVTILHGLEFRDPELGSLFRVVEARIQTGKTNTVMIPFRVHGMTNLGLNKILSRLNDNLLDSYGATQTWHIVFEDEMLIEEHSASQNYRLDRESELPPPAVALRNLQVDLVPQKDGTTAFAWFHLADWEPQEKAIRAMVSSTVQEGFWMQLDTRGSSIPCWLVAGFEPRLTKELGTNSEFSGFVEFWPEPDSSRLWVSGKLDHILLASDQESKVQESSTASIELRKCLLENWLPTEWDARLVRKGSSFPYRIRREDLMTFKHNISLNQGIRTTVEKAARANNDHRLLR